MAYTLPLATGVELGVLPQGWSITGVDIGIARNAVLNGLYGVKVKIDDQADDYIQTPATAKAARVTYARAYIQAVAGFAMVDGNAFALMYGYGSGTWMWRLELYYTDAFGHARLRLVSNDDGGAVPSAPPAECEFTIGVKHIVEVYWRVSSAPGADDGAMTLWLDEVEVDSMAGLDNDTRWTDRWQFGNRDSDVGTAGTLYFDNLRVAVSGPLGRYEAGSMWSWWD